MSPLSRVHWTVDRLLVIILHKLTLFGLTLFSTPYKCVSSWSQLVWKSVFLGLTYWWVLRLSHIYIRWANHKATANSEKSKSTGLSKHFIDGGCPNDTGRNKNTLRFTLVDYLDTSLSKLQLVGHVAGAKCRCSECEALKRLEDRFILKTGSFYTDGLNAHDQIKAKCRGNF